MLWGVFVGPDTKLAEAGRKSFPFTAQMAGKVPAREVTAPLLPDGCIHWKITGKVGTQRKLGLFYYPRELQKADIVSFSVP